MTGNGWFNLVYFPPKFQNKRECEYDSNSVSSSLIQRDCQNISQLQTGIVSSFFFLSREYIFVIYQYNSTRFACLLYRLDTVKYMGVIQHNSNSFNRCLHKCIISQSQFFSINENSDIVVKSGKCSKRPRVQNKNPLDQSR